MSTRSKYRPLFAGPDILCTEGEFIGVGLNPEASMPPYPKQMTIRVRSTYLKSCVILRDITAIKNPLNKIHIHFCLRSRHSCLSTLCFFNLNYIHIKMV